MMRSHAGRVLSGPAGTATEVIIDAHDHVDTTAAVACWFLYAPGQSIAWANYLLNVVHLRPIAGQEHEPVIAVPHATHELIMFALSPDLKPIADDPSTWLALVPVNACEQFEVPSDDDAVKLAELAARAVVDAYLPAEPPLSGQREPWRTAIIRTSAHMRGEVHAP